MGSQAQEIATAIVHELRSMVSDKWFRGTRTASQYAKISRPRLIQLLESREIAGYLDRGTDKPTWVIDRDSIDAYHRKNIAGPGEKIEEKVVAFMKNIKG